MITKSRMIVAGGLATVLATAGIAIAGGTAAELNDAQVDGKVSPSKLSKKKFKPVNLFSGVRNSDYTDGTGDSKNPASEFLSYSKNIKVDLRGTPRCPQLPNGIPTQDAKDTCPAGSFLGGGVAEVWNSTNPTQRFNQVVSVFHGPDQNDLQLHTYGDLGGLSPVVPAFIVDAPGAAWGQGLSVPEAPETGTLLITKFNAKLLKSKGIVKAKCKPKSFKFKREVEYKDGSSETVQKSQKCKVKRRR